MVSPACRNDLGRYECCGARTIRVERFIFVALIVAIEPVLAVGYALEPFFIEQSARETEALVNGSVIPLAIQPVLIDADG